MPDDPKDPQNDPQNQPSNDPPADDKPPWGEDFDPQKAWSLTQNLRGDKAKLKAQLDQAAADREELETLRNEKLTADDRALKEAKEQAASEAKSTADAEWRTRYLTSELKGIAAGVIRDKDELKSFMELVDPKKFATEDGEIDEEKIMGHLTAIYVGRDQSQPPRWGQNSGHQPPEKAGAAGRAALEKRHGVKNSS